jgi:hypothetical protein
MYYFSSLSELPILQLQEFEILINQLLWHKKTYMISSVETIKFSTLLLIYITADTVIVKTLTL